MRKDCVNIAVVTALITLSREIFFLLFPADIENGYKWKRMERREEREKERQGEERERNREKQSLYPERKRRERWGEGEGGG